MNARRAPDRVALAASVLARTVLLLTFVAVPAAARELATVVRIDEATVELRRDDARAIDVWIGTAPERDRAATRVTRDATARKLRVALPAETRRYLYVVPRGGAAFVVGERLVPLQQGSNFRDLGGYVAADGRAVRWGRAFRSAAMPLLTDRDYALLAAMRLDSIVDLRSLPERELVPDRLDDRTGALFLSNDYPLSDLMKHMGPADGEEMYAGLEVLLAPQFRMAFRRLLADRGAVVVHDVWGQDRVGCFVALLYDLLGVDRATIRDDFHLSRTMRRTRFELPDLRVVDHPGNPIVQYYAGKKAGGEYEPEALYTPSGASHIDRFLAYVDRTYGGSERYAMDRLGLSAGEIAALRDAMLEGRLGPRPRRPAVGR